MGWLHGVRLRWHGLLHRRRLERDLEDELQFHLETKALRNREAGMSPEEALYAARRQFGNPFRWKETIRDMWSLRLLESVLQDLRYAGRSLLKAPGFTAAAILVLALGIGSVTAIFSLLNAAVLRSLPFQNPERLVLLWGNVQRQKVERRGNSYPDYLDWKAQSTSFDGMAAYNDDSFNLTGVTEPERFAGEWVSAGYFELLGAAPIAGRTIDPREDTIGGSNAVVLLSEKLWQRRFGADPAIVGQQLKFNERLFTVIGIMPAWFRGLSDAADVWAPFTASSSAAGLAERGSRGFPAVAKLKQGLTVQYAQAELDGISKRLEQAYPGTNAKRAVEVAPLTNELLGQLRMPLFVLLGAVGFVLLIACANVANLLLARSEARRQEMAIRMALGAGRGRLFRQLFTESMLLSLTGAAMGLLLASWSVRILSDASPITLPTFIKPGLDWKVALFAAGVSILVGIVVVFLPAYQAGNQNPYEALKESGARSGDGLARLRFRGALVIVEVALALTLLIGAGLLMRSFQNLSALHPGFDPNGVLTMAATLPRGPAAPSQTPALGTPSAGAVVTGRQLLERMRSLPSVVSASLASDIPLGPGGGAIFYSAEGQPIMDAQTMPRAYVHRITPEFFATMGAQLQSGRTFSEIEMDGRANVVVVTDNLTRRFWAGQNPIGKRIKPGAASSDAPWWTIIGVVHEMKYRGLPENPTLDPDVFLPSSDRQRQVAILMRSSRDPAGLVAAARAAAHEIDPSITIFEVATLQERVGRAIERSRFAGWMMTVFAGLALTLAAIGLYGLMSYNVRRQTREIGVRIALGASHGDVVGKVVRNGMVLVSIGIAIGLAAALALTRLLHTLLFEVSPLDPLTFLAVAAALVLVALLACYLPARRAARIDPVTALRYE
ncbi:MAG: ABC transporter permease [Blastocatellia bacterium]|nr:ABC transporter permease [Blastocatellia bacterium]